MKEEHLDYKLIITSVVLVFFIGFFIMSGLEFTGMTSSNVSGGIVNPLWFLPAIAVFLLVVFLVWRGEQVFKRR